MAKVYFNARDFLNLDDFLFDPPLLPPIISLLSNSNTLKVDTLDNPVVFSSKMAHHYYHQHHIQQFHHHQLLIP